MLPLGANESSVRLIMIGTRTSHPWTWSGSRPFLSILAALGVVLGDVAQSEAQAVRDLPGQDRAASPVVQDLFSVGSMDGDDWELFGGSVQVAFGRQGDLFVWEAEQGREYQTLQGHPAAITAISWRSDSLLLATGSEDGTLPWGTVYDMRKPS